VTCRSLWTQLSVWSNAIQRYPNKAGTGPGKAIVAHRKAVSDVRTGELWLGKFDFAVQPASDSLRCALTFTHERVIPIESVDFAL
jgi:hypothetical protein